MKNIIKEAVGIILRPLLIFPALAPLLSGAQDTLPSDMAERYLSPGLVHYIANPIVSLKAKTFNGFIVKYYREPIHAWVSIHTGSDSIINSAMKGYSAICDSSSNYSCIIPYEGLLNTGSKGTMLTRTLKPGTDPPEYDGWNLVGNPYPSASDWQSTAWGLDNVDPTIYYFDGINYKPYNRVDQLGNGPSIIPAMQGFFVHVTSGSSGSLTVDNATRLHSTQPFYKSSMVHDNLLVLDASGNGYSDETFIQLDSIASGTFDWLYDAYKLMGISQSPQIYSMLSDADASINILPYGGPNTSVLMGFRAGVAGNYALTAHGTNSFLYVTSIVLWDKKLNIYQDFMTDSVYTFSSIPSDSLGRFEIFFNYTLNGTHENQTGETLLLYTYRDDLWIRNIRGTPVSGETELYDLIGQKVFSAALQNLPVQKFHPGVNEGYYLARLVTPGKTVVRKVFVTR